MLKALLKYFLALCILLLAGYGHLPAQANPNKEAASSVADLNVQGTASWKTTRNSKCAFFIGKEKHGSRRCKYTVSTFEKKENEEDDDHTSSKKRFDRICITSLFDNHLTERHLRDRQVLSLDSGFSGTSSCLYLQYCVYRI